MFVHRAQAAGGESQLPSPRSLATSASLVAQAPDYGYPAAVTLEQVHERLDQARSPHPRLLTSQAELEAIRRSLSNDPLRRQLADTLIRQADLMLDVAPGIACRIQIVGPSFGRAITETTPW